MATSVIQPETPQKPSKEEFSRRIQALYETGEIENIPGWGNGSFILGDGHGNWLYENFIAMFRACHGLMRAVDPTVPESLPPHCFDREFIADMFKIPLEKLNGPVKAKPAKPELPARPSIPSPYFDAQQAADYLGVTVKALYGHVERRKLKRLPGFRKYRFTREQLDAFLRGE